MAVRAEEVVPHTLKNLRACFFCSIIKTKDQFLATGCENCPLGLANDEDRVAECTTPHFSGLIAVCDPHDSWVCRWQRLATSTIVPGCYAQSVSGNPHDDLIGDWESATGRKYISRNTAADAEQPQ